MSRGEEPTQIKQNDLKPSYHVRLPIEVGLNNTTLTNNDKVIYCALDFLAGERGWWYGEQEEIIITACKRASKLSIPLSIVDVSTGTYRSAIRKLREQKLIVTEPMGLQMNNVLRYYVVARNPKLPLIHKRS